MQLSILTLFPELHKSFFSTSIIKAAVESKKLSVNIINLMDFCPAGVRVDAPTVGPGPGMVIRPEVIAAGISQAEDLFGKGFRIFFSAKGQLVDQILLQDLSLKIDARNIDLTNENKSSSHLILVCSRYEGVDQRAEDEFADLKLSIGNYVLMGGDLPAQVFVEGLVRLIPGILGNKESIEDESFNGPFLDYPPYCLPGVWNEKEVPEVLRSGHHEKIREWRNDQSISQTVLNRFDWLRTHPDTQKYSNAILNKIPNHYVVLMHNQVKVKQGNGTTSVTSVDLHDISRSCQTYGVKSFFVVTPLLDQQNIVESFLDFWRSPEGESYNQTRFQAVKDLIMKSQLSQVLDDIKNQTGLDPLLITTSAKEFEHVKKISFWDQKLVWELNRPVLIILGTGQGLDDQLIESSDFLLDPIFGLTDYNHLSVRSAAGIILDRWLGLNARRAFFDKPQNF